MRIKNKQSGVIIPMHYYKFNIADWVKDTAHLSLKEEAILLRLINYYVNTESLIPNKTQMVLRKLRIADESETVEILLEEFFIKSRDGWRNKELDKIISEYQKRAERNRSNGKSGGRPKNKDLDKPSGLPDGNQVETEDKPSGNLNQELLTTNQELITINDIKENKAPKVAVDFSVLQVGNSDLEEIKRIRKKNKGGTLTQRVVNALAKEFELAARMGYSLDDVLTEWEVRSWKSFKADWMPKKQMNSNYSQVTQRSINNLDGEW